MTYLKPPMNGDFKAMKQDSTDKMKSSWRKVTLFLNAHRDSIKLTDWEKYALKRAGEMTHQNTHDELEDLLRNFFAAAGSNIGVEHEDYKRRRRT